MKTATLGAFQMNKEQIAPANFLKENRKVTWLSALSDSCQARNQDFIWGSANETRVDQTTEMYILLSDPFI